MGNKCKRIETEKYHKDRGDLPQKLNLKEKDNMGINRIINLRRHLPDRGDVKGKRPIKPMNLEDDRARSASPRCKLKPKELISQATNTSLDVIILRSKPEGPETTTMEHSDYRARIRDRYTKRSKELAKISIRKDLIVKEAKSGATPVDEDSEDEESRGVTDVGEDKEGIEASDVLRIQSSDEPAIREKSKDPSETKSYVSIKTPKRKPIIKTITSKKDAVRVYKAVTFMDTPKMNTLQIKVPRAPVKKGEFKSRIPKRVKTISNHEIEQKPKKKVAKVKPAKISSPERFKTPSPLISAAKIVSPPTEVAKWSPSQNNTMPYYEAWVDTTLAAISKFSKKDKLFLEKQNILQMFKRQLHNRPELNNLDFDDERYTGKITVKQRSPALQSSP